jgi:hypothetical protein
MRFEGDGKVIYRHRWVAGVSVMLGGAGSLVLVTHLLDRGNYWALIGGLFWTLAGITFALYSALAIKWPRRVPVRVLADIKGLALDGELLARGGLTAGYLLSIEDPTVRLVLDRRLFPTLDIQLPTLPQAQDLIDALGLGVSRATVRFQAVYGGSLRRAAVVGGAMVLFIVLLVGGIYVADAFTGHGLPPAAMAAGMMWPYLSMVMMMTLMQTLVDVGADGIWLSRRKEFIPYAKLVKASIDDQDIMLVLEGQRPIRLGIWGTSEQDMARATCLQRIIEALAAFREGKTAVSPEALLAPAGRTMREWIQALRVVGAHGDYRTSAVPAEQLWRIVEDPKAAAPMRVGAAVALAGDLDDGARKRLRGAAQACAAQKLRVAFEMVAEDGAGDEVRLVRALESVAGG